MGDVDKIKEMRRFKQWISELISRIWRKIKLSRFFLGVICLAIGVSFTVCFYEGRQLKSEYDQSMNIWEEHLVNKANAEQRSGEGVSESETLTQSAEDVKGQTSASSIQELADLVWLKESTRGQHNFSKCEAIGKVNTIGHGIWKDKNGIQHWMCFENHTEEMKVLEDWIQDKRDKGMSDQELLCLYSGGNYKNCQ